MYTFIYVFWKDNEGKQAAMYVANSLFSKKEKKTTILNLYSVIVNEIPC